MNKIHFSGTILAGILITSVSVAADLNAPLVDHPTLGSEINRGWDAANDCNLHNLEALADSQCVDDASSVAQQQHTNHKPFELGLYFGEWQNEDLAATSDQSLPGNFAAQSDFPERVREAEGAYTVFRHLQDELGVTDAQLMAATTGDMNVQGKGNLGSRLRLWKASGGFPQSVPVDATATTDSSSTDPASINQPGTVILGVGDASVPIQLATLLKLEPGQGVLVVKVMPGSVASTVGIVPGDVILKFGDTTISDPEELKTAVAKVKHGDHVPITIQRGIAQQNLDAQF